jgi:hypothetical protein
VVTVLMSVPSKVDGVGLVSELCCGATRVQCVCVNHCPDTAWAPAASAADSGRSIGLEPAAPTLQLNQ